MLNVVSFKPPKFKPMPSELTPAVINGATLPVKIGIAQRAIAACCDLSELLTWKDKLAALAAAAKMARMPEMARDVNRVHKEAIFRMGEILLQYSGSPQYIMGEKRTCGNGRPIKGGKSERRKIADSLGIHKNTLTNSTRLAQASKKIRERILMDDTVSASAAVMAGRAPPTIPRRAKAYSDKGRLFLSGQEYNSGPKKAGGLVNVAAEMRQIRIELIAQLLPEEKQRARKFVVEMQEILDEIERRLGPAS